MKTWTVQYTMPVFVTVTVEAEDDESAFEKALKVGKLECYVGNGGTDRLIGTASPEVSLEVGDYYVEEYDVDVEEVKP